MRTLINKKLTSGSICHFTALAISTLDVANASESSFDTSFVELDTSKMITTGDSNYAICNHHFPSNWRR